MAGATASLARCFRRDRARRLILRVLEEWLPKHPDALDVGLVCDTLREEIKAHDERAERGRQHQAEIAAQKAVTEKVKARYDKIATMSTLEDVLVEHKSMTDPRKPGEP